MSSVCRLEQPASADTSVPHSDQVLNDPEHHKFFLRIELCEGGCCMPGDGPMEPLDEELARKYFRSSLRCHTQPITHQTVAATAAHRAN